MGIFFSPFVFSILHPRIGLLSPPTGICAGERTFAGAASHGVPPAPVLDGCWFSRLAPRLTPYADSAGIFFSPFVFSILHPRIGLLSPPTGICAGERTFAGAASHGVPPAPVLDGCWFSRLAPRLTPYADSAGFVTAPLITEHFRMPEGRDHVGRPILRLPKPLRLFRIPWPQRGKLYHEHEEMKTGGR
ncbi:hypothetical protein VNO77_31486 [Canavalia gladiata]|uniref:Uncharacterized protein n=1 Tax=Canavalia gladiata TaxID=3824 RepID=A0AAN9KSH2_CANGL